MRICLIGPVYPFRGGIAQTHACLGQALEEAGHAIQMVSFLRQYPAWLYPGQSDRDPSQNQVQLPVHYILDPLYPWTWEKAIREIQAFKPDLVLIQWWTVFWGPALAYIARRLHSQGLKIVFFIHNVLPHEQRRIDPGLARLALKQADAYITLTEREHQRLKNLLPDISKPVFTTPLPIYRLPSTSNLTKAEARCKLGLPENDPIILFFGLVRPYKGLHYLVEAFGQLKDDPRRPLLAIAGEFWENPQDYQDQIHHLGIDQRVRMENRYLPDEEAILWFVASDLFVAPHTDGTQSGAIRLAFGYNLPVIASDAISRELVGLDPATLVIIPAADADAIANAIRNWLSNPTRPAGRYSTEEEWSSLVNIIAALGKATSIPS